MTAPLRPDQRMRAYWQAISAQDLPAISEMFEEDARFEDVALGRVYEGRRRIVEGLRTFFALMPCSFAIDHIFATETDFAAQWTMSGRHVAEINEFPPPTGRAFAIRGASVGVVREGRIARKFDYWNVADMRSQLS